jgi:hypothetical protein
MLTLHKVEVFNAIQKAGLEPADFVVKETGNVFELAIPKSKILFQFIHKGDNYHVYRCHFIKFAPGSPITFSDEFTFNIHDIIGHFFIDWLRNDAKVYLNNSRVEDPFKVLEEKQNQFFNTQSESFSELEIKVIEKGLDDFALFAKETLQLDNGKLDQIQNDIKELKEDVRKVSKNKWIKYFYGFLIKEVWDFVRDDQKRQAVIDFFKNAYSSLSPYIHQLNQFN